MDPIVLNYASVVKKEILFSLVLLDFTEIGLEPSLSNTHVCAILF